MYSLFRYGLSLYVAGINLVLTSLFSLLGNMKCSFIHPCPIPPGLNDAYKRGFQFSLLLLRDPFSLSILSLVI